jgi:hypothetical protein
MPRFWSFTIRITGSMTPARQTVIYESSGDNIAGFSWTTEILLSRSRDRKFRLQLRCRPRDPEFGKPSVSGLKVAADFVDALEELLALEDNSLHDVDIDDVVARVTPIAPTIAAGLSQAFATAVGREQEFERSRAEASGSRSLVPTIEASPARPASAFQLERAQSIQLPVDSANATTAAGTRAPSTIVKELKNLYERVPKNQHHFVEAFGWVDEARRDREAGNLTEDELAWLAGQAQSKGRELTPAEANWALADFRRYRDF